MQFKPKIQPKIFDILADIFDFLAEFYGFLNVLSLLITQLRKMRVK